MRMHEWERVRTPTGTTRYARRISTRRRSRPQSSEQERKWLDRMRVQEALAGAACAAITLMLAGMIALLWP